MSNPYGVEVGQIWQDNNPRYQRYGQERYLRITEMDGTHASYLTVDVNDRLYPSAMRSRGGKIRLDRFKPTSAGYRRREDLEGQR